jgi:Dehydrogenases with different specificities (related to short-chain alcohol dehydrogenases)
MEIKGSVAVVTGGSGGLGRVISRKLAEAGANVAVVYQREEGVAREVCGELTELGVEAMAVQADVSSETDVLRMAQTVRDHFGRIDILVNDAAYNIAISYADMAGATTDIWDKIMGVNLKGPFLCMRTIGPMMKEQGNGRIVNIASIAGLIPTGSSIPYAVSKAGLIHLTRCMAVGLAPEVLVNAAAPGFMEGTRASANLSSEYLERARARSLSGNVISKEEVADQVLLFIRSDALTGQTLCMEGGGCFH